MSPKLRWFVGFAVVWYALDQATKVWARTLGPRDRVEVIPNWLDFVHAENPGAAFSALAGAEYRLVFFHGFSVLALVLLGSLYRALPAEERFKPAVVGLILSGVVGNWTDRILKGTVTDFVKVYAGEPDLKAKLIEMFGTNVYPIWNVADAALLVGIGLFLLQSFFEKDKETVDATGSAPKLDDDAARA